MDPEQGHLLFFMIIIIGAILVSLLFGNHPEKKVRNNSTPEKIPNRNKGASTTGLYGLSNGRSFLDQPSCELNGGNWSLGSCRCPPGKFGPSCNMSAYDSNYLSLGTVSSSGMKLKKISTESGNLSFEKDSCTELCDKDDSCLGVHWDSNQSCHLISDAEILTNTFTFNDDTECTTFVKSSRAKEVKVRDAAYLFPGEIPLRYFLSGTRLSTEPQLLIDRPKKLVNYSDYSVVLSPISRKWTLEYAKLMEARGSQILIYEGKGELVTNIPSSWGEVYGIMVV